MRRRLVGVTVVAALGCAACSSGGDRVTGASSTASTGLTDLAQPESTGAVATVVSTLAEPAATTPLADTAPTSSLEEPASAQAEPPPSTIDPIADRPFDVFVPSSYDPATPTPLVMVLHGYTGNSRFIERYFEFEPLADSRGFLYVTPDGTVDANGNQYWNATEACCSFGTNTPDDATYLRAVIDRVKLDYNVDPARVFLAGHSNGGFMSYRMACEHADAIAAVVSLAGSTYGDDAKCSPSEPVSVVQAHGTEDAVISYDGDEIGGAFAPSAPQTVAKWAAYNGCASGPTAADGLDLDEFLPGIDTRVEVFDGCTRGSAVELWSIEGASHSPALTEDFKTGVVDFFFDHPKS